MIKKISTYIKTHYIISAIIGLVIIGVGGKMLFSDTQTNQLTQVERGDVVQKVTVTGKVKPASEVKLAFERSGTVSSVSANIGGKVVLGQLLASQNSADAYATYQQAQANIATEEARLDELKRGTRPEELAVSEVQVTNAQVSFVDAQTNMQAKLLDSYTKSDDAIHNNIDQLFSNPRTTNPQINVFVNSTEIKNDINNSRVQVESLLSSWKDGPMPANEYVDALNRLSTIKNFIDTIAGVVNALSSNTGISQTTVDSYKTSVSNARNNIVTAITNLTAANEKLNTAQSTLSLAQSNLALKKIGNSAESIRAQQAKVMQFQAQLASANAELSKTSIRSPLSGIVIKQDAKVGQIAVGGTPVVSVISDNNLEIEANVSEISIGKIQVGNSAHITMDAFPGTLFEGTVTYIEPAETIVDGVVNFKVTVVFKEKYPELKTGLTANLDIITNTKENVLRVAQYGIEREDGKAFVLRRVGEKQVRTQIETGLVGNDGFVEVLSGISLGDSIELVNVK
jgi:HlyD family secretion protein